MIQDKLFLEENFNLHKSELDYLEETIKGKEILLEDCKNILVSQFGESFEEDMFIIKTKNQIARLKEIKKSLLKLVELEKMYNIYQKTETDEKIIVGNILNILGDNK